MAMWQDDVVRGDRLGAARDWMALSAPGYLICIWTLVIAFLGGSGFVIGKFALPFWIGTACFSAAIVYRGANLTALLVPLGITAVVMSPWLWHGISNYPGSILWDGWFYLALGETMKDNALYTPMPPDPGLSPMYQMGFFALNGMARFTSPALIALFQGVFPPGGDTQAAVGFVLLFYVFVFACSIGTLGTILFPENPGYRVGYIVGCTMSGFVLTMLRANNYDQLLAMTMLPIAAAVSFRLEWGNWKSAAVIGGINAALVISYPELAPAAVAVSALILMWRLWDERPASRAIVITVGVALLVFTIGMAPVAAEQWRFFNRVLFATLTSTVRSGENYFPGFYIPHCTFGSFAMLYAPAVASCTYTFMGYLAGLIGALILIASGAGVLLAKGRFVAVTLCAALPFLAACYFLLARKYDYGAYKLLTIGFPFVAALVLYAIATIKAAWLKLVAIAAIAANFFIVVLRIEELDIWAPMKSVNVWKVPGIPPNSVVALKIKDLLAFQWATYYLRDQRIVPLVGHLVYMPKPRSKNTTEPPEYLVSDQKGDDCVGELLWSSVAYKVFRITQPACLTPSPPGQTN